MMGKSSDVGLGVSVRVVEDVSLQELVELFPNKKKTINEKTVELVNEAQSNPEFNGVPFIKSMVQFRGVMEGNECSLVEYINALKFCAFLESSEDSYVEAYKKTFYDREFVKKRANLDTDSVQYKELTSAASRYRRSKLVVDILTQADVPLYLMFQGFRHQAVMLLADRMMNSKLDKDKINAADRLLVHVAPPANMKIEMDVGVKRNSIIDDYEVAMAKMVEKQRELIIGGGDIKGIANAAIRYVPEECDEEECDDGK